MNLFAAHTQAGAQHEAELGVDCPRFIWNGTTYKMIPGSAIRKKDLGSGGFAVNADLAFTCLVAQFGQTAQDTCEALLEEVITYLGDGYRVASVFIEPGALQLHIEANSETQNV